ncbi:MAG: ABC transporter permease [Candidatus Hydrogenedentes bacterium]|nr:ABC transporter permease [Candidatus Hydrogenedentota bacterium]
MSKIMAVAVRECVETVKSKLFLISIFLTPALVIAIAVAGPKMMKNLMDSPQPPKKLTVLDMTASLADEIRRGFDSYNQAHPTRLIEADIRGPEAAADLDTLKNEVHEGRLVGCLVVAAGVVENSDNCQFYVLTDRLVNMDCISAAKRILEDTVTDRRLHLYQVPADLFEKVNRRVVIDQVDVAAPAQDDVTRMVRVMAPFGLMFLMMLGLFGTSQGMLTSVIEEKNSRVIELLLASLTPFQLMTGKILGLAAIGLTVITIWLTAGFGALVWSGLLPIMPSSLKPVLVMYFVCFFMLGYLLYSSVYAAIGAACNTLKEAQSLLMPIMLCMILPTTTWMYIVQSPDGLYARLLSYFPLTAPLVTPVRLAAKGGLPPLEVVLVLLGLTVTAIAVMWAASRIFRIGILMYGKPPGIRELFRWVKG